MKKQYTLFRFLCMGVVLLVAPFGYAMDATKKTENPATACTLTTAAPVLVVNEDQKNTQKPLQLTDNEWQEFCLHIRVFKAAHSRCEILQRKRLLNNPKNELLIYFAERVREIMLSEVLRFFKQRNIKNDQLEKTCEVFAQSNSMMTCALPEDRNAFMQVRDALKYQDRPLFKTADRYALFPEYDSSLMSLLNAIVLQDVAKIRSNLNIYKNYFDKPGVIGYAPLFFAVYINQPAIVALLLENGAPARYFNEQGLCALLLTLPDSEGRIIDQMLKDYSASVNVKSKDGSTPLMSSIKKSNRALFDALSIGGAFLHAHDNQGRTAYYFAIEQVSACDHAGHEHCCPFVYMEERLQGGLNEVDPANDMTPLMTAAQAGNVNQVIWLLGHGADVKKIGTYNKTKTAYNLATDGAIKVLLEMRGAQGFEEEHVALQAKKREEIRLKLSSSKDNKVFNEGSAQSDRLIDLTKDTDHTLKHAIFGMIFGWYHSLLAQHTDQVVTNSMKDLLQRSLIRLILDYKAKKIPHNQIEQLVGNELRLHLVKAAVLLGIERLTLLGFEKEQTLNLTELARLIYAQDNTDKPDILQAIDNKFDRLIFISMWKVMHLISFQDFIRVKNSFNTSPEDIYQKLLKDAPDLVRSIATAGDSFGNTLLHYAVLLNDFPLATHLIAAQAVLERHNAKGVASIDLIIRMGNSDKLKDLLIIAGGSIKRVFRKSIPSLREVEQKAFKAHANAAAGTAPTDREIKALEDQNMRIKMEQEKQLALKQAQLLADEMSKKQEEAKQEKLKAQKLALAQKAQELEKAQLAEKQAVKKAAKTAKQSAKKERRNATRLEEESSRMQQQRDEEIKRRADQELAARKTQEEEQQKKLEAQKELERAREREQEERLQEAKRSQERVAYRIYKKHIVRPDIYAEDESDAPTNYTQWLENHGLCYGSVCELCTQPAMLKAQIAKENMIKEQLQRRKTALDQVERENILHAQNAQKEKEQKQEEEQKKEKIKDRFAEHLKKMNERLAAKK